MSDLVVVPSPGTDLVPDGWAESTVVPWLAEQTDGKALKEAAAQLAGLEVAYRTLDADTLELVKARRYLEIRWGELLGEAEHGGDRRSDQVASAQLEHPLDKFDRHRFRQLAENRERVEHILKDATDADELSRAALLRSATGAHVGNNSGDNEWYTPAAYINGAVAVMGSIDLDPASTSAANEVVGAAQFFTAQDNALNQKWEGRVWMNPPYSRPLIDDFCGKLAEEYAVNGNVDQACVLVNNATETGWFHQLAEVATAACFPRGRVKFWHPRKESVPLQGQSVLYFGEDIVTFRKVFVTFGFTVVL